jgi:hypothetical protein
MKKPLIIALLGYSIFLGSIAAQNANKPTDINIESVKGTIIYAGIDNTIRVVCPGLEITDYVVTTDKGAIFRSSKEFYKLKPFKTGLITVQVLVKGKVQYKKIFQAVPIPNPTPLLGAYLNASDTVQLGKFKAMTGIRLAFDDTELNGKCELVSFRVTQVGTNFMDGKILAVSAVNTGAKFTGDAQKLMAEATPGDLYIFNEIKVKCPGDSEERELTPLVYFMENPKD